MSGPDQTGVTERPRAGFFRRLFCGAGNDEAAAPANAEAEPAVDASQPQPDAASPADTLGRRLDDLRERIDAGALEQVTAAFRLSPFERDLLLFCAGVELDPELRAVAASHSGLAAHRPGVTFGLAMDLLPDPHWSALTPWGPLRRWRLVRLADDDAPRTSRIAIDERVLHHLCGIDGGFVDDRLDGLVELLPPENTAEPAMPAAAEQIAALWRRHQVNGPWPLIQLCGPSGAGHARVAGAACAALGWRLLQLRAANMPASAAERAALARLCERELVLGGGALLVSRAATTMDDAASDRALVPFFEDMVGPVIFATEEPVTLERRPAVRLDILPPGEDQRRALWAQTLSGSPMYDDADADERLDRLADQFGLDAPGIRAARAAVARDAEAGEQVFDALWDASRIQARRRLDGLAQRIEARATWDDIVLPAEQLDMLREIALQVRHRRTVYRTWGFAETSGRGLGITALFSGPSGTGKTMAAEVLANALRLDLHRIDLSQVVSKYIGETEKNLKRIFDAAEDAGSVLLFDEADTLFGKRSEVKDSHDRYANIEVGYLLQRMEAYRGCAILTTNLQNALDQSFLRRLRFICRFPFPSAELREAIWRRIFPPQTPTEDLDQRRLARLSLAGGNIRNIAMNAAFLAAEDSGPVRMEHVLRAARGELAKQGKALPAIELRGVA